MLFNHPGGPRLLVTPYLCLCCSDLPLIWPALQDLLLDWAWRPHLVQTCLPSHLFDELSRPSSHHRAAVSTIVLQPHEVGCPYPQESYQASEQQSRRASVHLLLHLLISRDGLGARSPLGCAPSLEGAGHCHLQASLGQQRCLLSLVLQQTIQNQSPDCSTGHLYAAIAPGALWLCFESLHVVQAAALQLFSIPLYPAPAASVVYLGVSPATHVQASSRPHWKATAAEACNQEHFEPRHLSPADSCC